MKLKNKKIYNIVRKLYYKYPSMRKFIFELDKKFLFKPVFVGGLIKTECENPWNDNFQNKVFEEAIKEIKDNLESNLDKNKVDELSIDIAKWRYWIISYAVKHAIEFSEVKEYNFVECGVAEGFSSYIALKEIIVDKKVGKKFLFHLYDSWKPMRKGDLVESEYSKEGKYEHLDQHVVKRNLKNFEEFLVYHPGYIPDTFKDIPESPSSIVYLAIDLNAVKPTIDTLNKFLPALVRGGVIIFDDYGVKEYHDTKKAIDEFLHNKQGVFLKLPTGQAIFFR
jgi:hypothetical protein